MTFESAVAVLISGFSSMGLMPRCAQNQAMSRLESITGAGTDASVGVFAVAANLPASVANRSPRSALLRAS